MPLNPAQQAARDRLLNFYDGDAPYDPVNNPGGFRRGGNVPNFEPALKDAATVVQGAGVLVGDAQTAAGQAGALRDQAQAAVATGRVGYDTLAQLMANLAPADGAQGEVRKDSDPTKNGTYTKVGAPGSGTWRLDSNDTLPGVAARTRNRQVKPAIDGGSSDVDPNRRVLSKITREGHLLQGRNLLRPVLGRHADLRTDEAGRILEATGRDGSLIQGLTEYRASITGTVGIFTENGSPIAVRDALGVDPEAAAYHATVIEGQVLAWVGGAPVKITGGTDYAYADASISGGQITIVRSDLKLWTSPLRGRWPVLAPGTDTIIVSDTVGQSNAAGNAAGGVIHANSFNPRFLMFAAGQRTYGNWLGHSQERQQPLYISPDATLDIDYGREHVFGDAGETSSSGFAHGVLSASALPARASLLTTVSAVGSASPEMILRNATELTSLVNVMGAPFAMEEAKFIRAVLMGRLSGKRVYAGPVRVNIGESIIGRSKADAYASYAAIAADWFSLARQWNALWPAAGMGGFEAKAPALIAQTCSGAIYGFAKSQVPWAQLQIGLDDPTTALCIGPTYDQAYAADGVHLLAAGQEMWGARAAVAWNAWLRGERYMPLHVRKDAGFAPVRTGTTVRLRIYNHFNLPLVFDAATVTGLGPAQGFGWFDNGDGNAVTVTNATIVDSTTVDVFLSAAPTGTGGSIDTAMNGASGALSGPVTGNRSSLRTNGSGIFTDGNFAAPRAVEHFICIDRVPVV